MIVRKKGPYVIISALLSLFNWGFVLKAMLSECGFAQYGAGALSEVGARNGSVI